MSIFGNVPTQSVWKKLSALKLSVEQAKNKTLQKRLASQPLATKLEYHLGAFVEMYEPHLKDYVVKLAKKGYLIDASSGFGGKNCELQVIKGNFTINYILRNKLEKIGIKQREYQGYKSLVFYPKKATLDCIKDKWMKLVDILPEKEVLDLPSNTNEAVAFRRKYVPADSVSQKQRSFDKLRHNMQKKMKEEIRKRKKVNPHPDKAEYNLGLFMEEIEPQVRRAVIKMNEKGYSTDASGFLDEGSDQMIDGDFRLEEKAVSALERIGAKTETNASGYTRIKFTPTTADISKIKKKWHKIVSLLPDKKRIAGLSMTRKARDFRLKYQ